MSIESLTTLAWDKLESLPIDHWWGTPLSKICRDEKKMGFLMDFLTKKGKSFAEDPTSFLANKLISVITEARVKGKPLSKEKEYLSLLEPILLKQEKDTIAEWIFKPYETVKNGYGEFIVYSKSKVITKEDFLKAYCIFCKYLPGNLAAHFKNDPGMLEKVYGYRDLCIGPEIKKIDPDWEIAFIPRTLYELVFIRKCIREDVKRGKDCPLANRVKETEREVLKSDPKCLHRIDPFTSSGQPDDVLDCDVVDTAYRLNQTFAKKIRKMKDLSYHSIAQEAQKEIQFLRNYYTLGPPVLPNRGMAYCFKVERDDETVSHRGIRDETDATILRKMIALECGWPGRKSVFLTRGATFEDDSPDFDGDCMCLSFGTSLFAGIVYDPGACAFMRGNISNDLYTVIVPVTEFYTSPFFMPNTNTLPQLFGLYEDWHPRTKIWKGNPKLMGFNPCEDSSSYSTAHLQSSIPQNELVENFITFKEDGIIWRRQ